MITWPDPLIEFIGFIGVFLTVGAVGFRYAVLGRLKEGAVGAESRPGGEIFVRAARRAASWGFLGAVISIVLLTALLPERAANQDVTVGHLVTHDPRTALRILFALMALGAFPAAMTGRRGGWPFAALSVIAGAVVPPLFAKRIMLDNPLHELAAALWIGTLGMLIFAGFTTVLGARLPADRRGRIAAEMVHAFSPMAMGAVAMLGFFGALTAWRHLEHLSALWSTLYGRVLIAKLVMVAFVLALGAWNWRRQRPRLGNEDAAHSLRRSARAELFAALVVLVLTSLLVSVHEPRPEAPSQTPPPAAGAP